MALELTEEQKKAGWQVVTLGDLFTVKHGFAFKGENFSEDPSLPTVVTPGNFSVGGGFKQAKTKTYLGNYPKVYQLAPQDFIVTMTDLSKTGDTLGYPALIPSDNRTYLHNQRIGKIVFSSDVAIPEYIYYRMRCSDYHAFVLGTASGSTVRHTSPSKIEMFELALPPVSEQKRIAEILGSVDDKIEANSRLLDSLYQLLRELYFYKIAKNSDIVLLTNIADFVNGKAFTKDATGTGRMVVRIAELNNGPGASTVYNDVETVDEKNLVNAGELLMSWSGSLGVFLWSREEAIVNQHIFKVIPKPGYSRAVVYCALESVIEDFQAIAKDKATTMGHIKRGDLETEVKIPSSTSELEAVFSQISVLEREKINLAEARNFLIHKLIK